MEPKEIFATIIRNNISRILHLISFNFTDPNYKQTLLTKFAVIYSSSFPIFSITTCFETDMAQCVQSLVCGSIGAQCAAKAFFALLYDAALRSNLKIITNLYEVNQNMGCNKDDLRKTARFNHIVAKLFALSFSASGLFILVGPFAVYYFTGEIIPLLPVKVLFISTDTTSGFIFHVIYHMFGTACSVIGVTALDTYMLTTIVHIWPMTRILERSVSNFNRAARGLNHEAFRDSIWLKLQMRNIVLMHREIFFYVRRISELSHPLSTAELYTDQAGLIMLVYCILALKWPPAILFFISFFIKLFTFCLIGTAVDYFNDKTYEALVAIDYTILPIDEQKKVIIMLHVAQHPRTLAAGLVKMNMMTFVEVLKTIYSVGMLLLESI